MKTTKKQNSDWEDTQQISNDDVIVITDNNNTIKHMVW